jgi:NADPH2:quinone reductase
MHLCSVVQLSAALTHLGQLTAGDSVVIHAAAGEMGSAAIQLAHAKGGK